MIRNKKILIPMIVMMFMMIFIGCGDSSSSSSKSSSTPKVGSSVTLTDGGIFCTSKKNVDKMISFIQEKNKDGQNGMFTNGEAMIIKKGEKVNVTDGGMVTEVEYKNKKWYAPMEVVK